jgi:MoaA/NifB/PqqE/SkfB family radical SAM enzyme
MSVKSKISSSFLSFFYLPDRNLKNPKFISIDISNTCNLRCRICKQWKDENKHEKIKHKDMKTLIDQIKTYFPNTLLEFSGQEPLLKQDLLFNALLYANDVGVKTALSTNGTLVDKKIAKSLITYDMHHISISLDGFEKTHNYLRNSDKAFKSSLQGLKNLLLYKRKIKSDTAIAVTFVITALNFREIPKFYNFLKKLGVDCINFNSFVIDNSYFFDPSAPYDSEFWIKNKDLNDFKKIVSFLTELKKEESKPTITNSLLQLKLMPDYFEKKQLFNSGKCLAGYNYFHITNFGEVTVCGKGPKLNIKSNNIRVIWLSKQFDRTRKKVENCKKPCLNNCFYLE